MAEGWVRQLARKLIPELHIDAQSAGLAAHGLNPKAVAVTRQHGVDISSQTSDRLNHRMTESADLIITVCSHADSNCPILLPDKEKLHLPFADPAKAS